MIYIYYQNEQEKVVAEKYSKSEVFDGSVGSENWSMVSDLSNLDFDCNVNDVVKIINVSMIHPLLDQDINKIGFVEQLIDEIDVAKSLNKEMELLFLLPDSKYNDPTSVRSKLFHELKIHSLGKFKPRCTDSIYGTFRSNPFLFTIGKLLVSFMSLTPELTKEIVNV